MGSFKDVVGHKDILKYISSAVENNRVSHAYILNGDRGHGGGDFASGRAAALLGAGARRLPRRQRHADRRVGQRGDFADRAEEQLSALFQAVHDVRFPDDAAEPRDLFGLSVFAVHPLRRGDGEVRSGRAGFFYIRTTRQPGRRGSRF